MLSARAPSHFNLADGFTKAVDEVTVNDHRFPVHGQDVLPSGKIIYYQVDRKQSKTKTTMEVAPQEAKDLCLTDEAESAGISAALHASKNGVFDA